jgi:hypothetical protein
MVSVVGQIVGQAAKVLIMISVMCFGFLIYKGNLYYEQNVNSFGLILVIMAFEGYFVGSHFVNLFVTTYDTMIVCYLIEMNIEEFCGVPINRCPQEVKDVLGKIG